MRNLNCTLTHNLICHNYDVPQPEPYLGHRYKVALNYSQLVNVVPPFSINLLSARPSQTRGFNMNSS